MNLPQENNLPSRVQAFVKYTNNILNNLHFPYHKNYITIPCSKIDNSGNEWWDFFDRDPEIDIICGLYRKAGWHIKYCRASFDLGSIFKIYILPKKWWQ